jgi:hypothetical protein
VQELGDDQVGDVGVELGAEEDDPFLQQPGVDVERPLSAWRVLDDGGDQHGRSLRSAGGDVQPLDCTVAMRPEMCNHSVAWSAPSDEK